LDVSSLKVTIAGSYDYVYDSGGSEAAGTIQVLDGLGRGGSFPLLSHFYPGRWRVRLGKGRM